MPQKSKDISILFAAKFWWSQFWRSASLIGVFAILSVILLHLVLHPGAEGVKSELHTPVFTIVWLLAWTAIQIWSTRKALEIHDAEPRGSNAHELGQS